MSKVTEKIILHRINNIDNSLHLTPENQFGFKPGRSTALAAAKLAHDITVGFKTCKNTVAVALDMEKAFDKVWHNGLLFKLYFKFHIPKNLLVLLKSYLSDRYFQVKIFNTLSQPSPIGSGVPQGTVLAPKLYTLYTADLPESPSVNTLLYADDTLFYSQSFFAQVANRRLTLHMNSVQSYFKHWKLSINPTKTQEVIFTRKFTNNRIFERLKIDNTQIDPVRDMKYLGLTLDRRLSFNKHVNALIAKTHAATHRLYPVLARGSQTSLANKILLYKVALRPVLTFACPVWQSMSPTLYSRLQRVQNKLLRLVTNSDRYVNLDELHANSDVPRLQDFIADLSQRFYTTAIAKSPITANITEYRHGHNLREQHKFIYQNLPIYFQPN